FSAIQNSFYEAAMFSKRNLTRVEFTAFNYKSRFYEAISPCWLHLVFKADMDVFSFSGQAARVAGSALPLRIQCVSISAASRESGSNPKFKTLLRSECA